MPTVTIQNTLQSLRLETFNWKLYVLADSLRNSVGFAHKPIIWYLKRIFNKWIVSVTNWDLPSKENNIVEIEHIKYLDELIEISL